MAQRLSIRFLTVSPVMLGLTALLGLTATPLQAQDGAVYGLSPSECGLYGGEVARDRNGTDTCSLGKPMASYDCPGAGPVSLVRNRFGETFLILGGGLEKVTESGSGLWIGPRSTLLPQGRGATFSGATGTTQCAPARKSRGGAGAPSRRNDSEEQGAPRN